MIPNLKLYAAMAVAGVLVATAYTGLWKAYEAYTNAMVQVDELKARVGAAEARVGHIQTQATRAIKEAQAARRSLDHAIDQDPADAAERTPAAVVDSLCGKLRCAGKPD